MNQTKNNDSLDRSSPSIGGVLSNMIQQLNSGNSSVVGQIREMSQSTTSTLDRIGQTLGSTPQSAVANPFSKEILNVLNPIPKSNGSNILTSLFLGPVWKGIFTLFNRSGQEQQIPLSRYSFRENSRTDLGASLQTDGEPSALRPDAFGLSRQAQPAQAPINISIQALDARSILDRSDDIAAALKQAMLSNHEINDSLNEI